MLMPIMPALALCLNSRAALPLRVKMDGYAVLDDRPGGYGDKKKPPTFAARLAECIAHPDHHLHLILAELVAKGMDLRTFSSGSVDHDDDALVRALPVDLYVEQALAAFDYERYFNGISGAARVAALAAMGGADMAKNLKKGEQVVHCVGEAKRTGWLPKELAVPAIVTTGA